MKLVEAEKLVIGNEYIIVYDNEEILRDKIETVRHLFHQRGPVPAQREIRNYRTSGEILETKPMFPEWADCVSINISFVNSPFYLPLFGSRTNGFGTRLKIYEVPVVLKKKEEDAQTIEVLKAQLKELQEINAKLLGGNC